MKIKNALLDYLERIKYIQKYILNYLVYLSKFISIPSLAAITLTPNFSERFSAISQGFILIIVKPKCVRTASFGLFVAIILSAS